MIYFDEKEKQFHLYNKKIRYVFRILSNGQLANVYFGKNIPFVNSRKQDIDTTYRVMHPSIPEQDKYMGLNFVPQELPVFGQGDYRPEALRIEKQDGNQLDRFSYVSHEIRQGKELLEGLPCGRDLKDVESLIVRLEDKKTNLVVELHYVLYAQLSLVTRSMKIINQSQVAVKINKAMSLTLDLPDSNYHFLQLDGAWARERHIHKTPLRMGSQSIGSNKGASSAEHNPFAALVKQETTEHQGEIIAASLLYSGNFLAEVNVSTFGTSRLQIGINPETFSWKLNPGEAFQSPEATLVYSQNGLNDLSNTFHQFVREYLIDPKWNRSSRPILYNNWEATYMDFSENQLISLAEEASSLGAELFVLDDGWFGERNHDRASLGDWFVNKQKFPQGLGSLIEKVNRFGMDFGIWIEPEMINEDSELYRQHPNWLIHHPNYQNSPSRNQYVLDYTRTDVVDHIYLQLHDLLTEYPIRYVKWDMNRYISEPFSLSLPFDRQGEFYHRYILGVYRLYDQLTKSFPDVLFESCSSGGARFDLGLLYYAPQTWTSDNTDAMDRLKIQYGTSLVYPPITMGAHVSAVPNHQTGRITSLETRGHVAFFGNFGYELDIMVLTKEEKISIKEQIKFYKKHRQNFQYGTFYRLLSPFEGEDASWQVVSEDKTEVIVGYYRFRRDVNQLPIRLKLKGLDEEATYECDQELYTGGELMEIGLILNQSQLTNQGEDFSSCLKVIYKQK